MKADGMTPLAFTDKDGWPAMGTFDILNMRINGYEFHVDLMAGKESWDSPQVKAVFNQWKRAPAVLLERRARPDLAGGRPAAVQQAGRHVPARLVRRPAVHEPGRPRRPRLLRLPGDQPEVRPGLARRADRRLHDVAQGPDEQGPAPRRCSSYLGSAAAAEHYLQTDSNDAAANKKASTAQYNALQKKSATLIASAKHIAQYMDRDTRPDFASTVMIPALQPFLNNPNDVNGLVASIQKQKKSIFGS